MSASASSMSTVHLNGADDMHLHIRDGELMCGLMAHVTAQFRRALIMPNLKQPVTTVQLATEYRQRILDAVQSLPGSPAFTPLMSLYLTDQTTPEEIRKAKRSGFIVACKLYPQGATTNSASGVTDLKNIYPVLQAMSDEGILLLIHGEVTDPDIDIFDREAVFLTRHLQPIVQNFPNLRIVLEHITTKQAADFVLSAGPNVAATITAHHLLLNRNAIFHGGLSPHHYCLPVLKREDHRQSLISAAISGNPKFFAGTDSAPHPKHTKEAAKCCAGCYTSFAALELYAETFASVGALDKLNNFVSRFGAEFYKLPLNTDGHVTLVNEEWTVPNELAVGGEILVPLRAGATIHWKLQK